jgi:hypothetical protein
MEDKMERTCRIMREWRSACRILLMNFGGKRSFGKPVLEVKMQLARRRSWGRIFLNTIMKFRCQQKKKKFVD